MSKYTEEQQKFITIFNLQHSQITQNEFEQLNDLLIKYPKNFAISKLDVGKINSTLILFLKPDAVCKKQRASKVPIHLQDKINRLLETVKQYEIIPPLKKKNSQKVTRS